VLSVSFEADPEGGEGSAWVAGMVAQGGGDVDRPCPAQRPDHQVPPDRHDAWGGAGADLRAHGHRNIAAALRYYARDATRVLPLLGIISP
jgi:hypothetical protein